VLVLFIVALCLIFEDGDLASLGVFNGALPDVLNVHGAEHDAVDVRGRSHNIEMLLRALQPQMLHADGVPNDLVTPEGKINTRIIVVLIRVREGEASGDGWMVTHLLRKVFVLGGQELESLAQNRIERLVRPAECWLVLGNPKGSHVEKPVHRGLMVVGLHQ